MIIIKSFILEQEQDRMTFFQLYVLYLHGRYNFLSTCQGEGILWSLSRSKGARSPQKRRYCCLTPKASYRTCHNKNCPRLKYLLNSICSQSVTLTLVYPRRWQKYGGSKPFPSPCTSFEGLPALSPFLSHGFTWLSTRINVTYFHHIIFLIFPFCVHF